MDEHEHTLTVIRRCCIALGALTLLGGLAYYYYNHTYKTRDYMTVSAQLREFDCKTVKTKSGSHVECSRELTYEYQGQTYAIIREEQFQTDRRTQDIRIDPSHPDVAVAHNDYSQTFAIVATLGIAIMFISFVKIRP